MATLKYLPEAYYAVNIRHGSMTEKQAREEYSRLRSIALKRLKRFEGTEWEESLTYRSNINAYPKLRDMRPVDVPYKLEELSRFITAKRGSVSGLKKERATAIATLRARGYKSVNAQNFKYFTEFMEEWRMHVELQQYDSEQVSELAEFMAKRRISVAEAFDAPPEVGNSIDEVFSWWLDNYDEIKKADERAARRHERKPRSAEEYARAILKN